MITFFMIRITQELGKDVRVTWGFWGALFYFLSQETVTKVIIYSNLYSTFKYYILF